MAAFDQDDEYVTNFDSAESLKRDESKEELNEEVLSPPPSKTTQKDTTSSKSKVYDATKTYNHHKIDFKVESLDDVVRIVKSLGRKFGFRTNPKHGTLVAGFLLVLGFSFLRYCSFKFFFLVSLLPIMYGLFGSRTFALGSLKGKVVVVTGASSGLGRGLAIQAAKQGAEKVVLVARSLIKLQETAKLVRIENGGNCEPICVSCDVTQYDQVAKLAARCEMTGDIGLANLVINCAGSGDWKPILITTSEEAANNMACPYLAAFNMTRAFLPSMSSNQQEPRHIMNVTSAAAYTAWKGSATYGSARWAVRGFTEYLRCEVKQYGIGVTLLNPGQIRGTDYFANNQIDFKTLPWLFSKGFNDPRAYDCEMVSSRALRGCVDGECEVHVPGPMAHTTTWLTALVPSVVWAVIDFKPFWGAATDKENKADKEENKKNN